MSWPGTGAHAFKWIMEAVIPFRPGWNGWKDTYDEGEKL